MSTFRYVAARRDGGRVRGRLEAATAATAAHELVDRGLFPLRVEADSRATRWPWRPPARALAHVMQSLASLTEAGVPLERALDATAGMADARLRDTLGRVRDRVREGSALWAALAAEDLFQPVTIGLVQAGERGVGLAAGLAQAAHQLEREAETRAHLHAALAYPLLLLAVGSLSIVFMLFFVLPRFAALLADSATTLPAATRALLAASTMLREHAFWSLATAAVALGVAGWLAMKHREAWATTLLALPIIGSIRHGLATARVARALGALLGTGVSALPALEVAQAAAGDRAVQRRLDLARQRVSEGASLGDALGATAALTPAAVQLIRIGEGSGKTAELLARAALLEEQTAARRVRGLVAALEPALIIAFALVVAFIAGALLQAIYSVRPGWL